MNEFLNKTISSNLSQSNGFKIEASIYTSNECHRILLKSFKDGNIMHFSASFHYFTLEKAVNTCSEALRRHINNFDRLQNEDSVGLRDILNIHLELNSAYKQCLKYNYLMDTKKELVLDEIINNTNNKIEALKYLNDNFYDLVSI